MSLLLAALIFIGGPCFFLFYFFDFTLIAESSSEPGKIELATMSYIALALTAFGGWAMISAEKKEAKKIEEKNR
jgi:hypothetical protein